VLKTYHLIDRNNGCRLVPALNGAGLLTIRAESQDDGEIEALDRGFNCDWIAGDYHLVDVNEALAGSGLKMKEDSRD
jgi:hypothetical protein